MAPRMPILARIVQKCNLVFKQLFRVPRAPCTACWETILGKLLCLLKQGRIFNQTSSLIITKLLLLLYVVKESSSLNHREKRTILNRIQPCKGKPNTHAWNTKGSFRSNRLPFIPTRGSDQPQATAGHTHFQSVGRTSIARLQNPYSWLPSNTYSYTSNQVTKRSKYMWWGVCPLLGPIGY
jgi:hypothetical protein